MTILMVVIGVILYLVVGFFATQWYSRRLEELEAELFRERRMEFDILKEIFWTILCLFFWWAVLPYELATGFRQWRYPYCDPDYKPERRVLVWKD